MIPTSAVMTASRRRTPWSWAVRIANVTNPVSTPAGSRGMPKSRWKPSAAPTNSARSQAIATASACSQRKIRIGRVKRMRLTSARLWPVAIPSFALIVWISIAIRFERRMTHNSR